MISNIFEDQNIWRSNPRGLVLIDNHQAAFQDGLQSNRLLCIGGAWQCDCEDWKKRIANGPNAWCQHTIALQYTLTAIGNSAAFACQAELVQ